MPMLLFILLAAHSSYLGFGCLCSCLLPWCLLSSELSRNFLFLVTCGVWGGASFWGYCSQNTHRKSHFQTCSEVWHIDCCFHSLLILSLSAWVYLSTPGYMSNPCPISLAHQFLCLQYREWTWVGSANFILAVVGIEPSVSYLLYKHPNTKPLSHSLSG